MLNIPKLTDLKYRDILDRSRNRAFQESQGTLNDFSRHNPLYVLLSALSFAGTEILHYANKFGERFALIYIGYISGQGNIEGTKALTTIQFTLNSPVILEIPVNTKVKGNFNDQSIIFLTTENLIFDGSETVKSVGGIAQNVGDQYSIPPFTLTSLIQPISFVSEVTNTTQATGKNPKSQDEFINDALTALRSRSLVAESDFIYWGQLAMGTGSLASVIPNLSADQSSFEIGATHLFCLNSNLEPASGELINQIETFIYQNSPPLVGTNLYISPMKIEYIRIRITLEIDNSVGFRDTVERIYNRLTDYLNPSNHKPGDEFNIRQFEAKIWTLPGIKTFEPIEVNGRNISLTASKDVKFIPQYVSATVLQNESNQEILIGRGEI